LVRLYLENLGDFAPGVVPVLDQTSG